MGPASDSSPWRWETLPLPAQPAHLVPRSLQEGAAAHSADVGIEAQRGRDLLRVHPTWTKSHGEGCSLQPFTVLVPPGQGRGWAEADPARGARGRDLWKAGGGPCPLGGSEWPGSGDTAAPLRPQPPTRPQQPQAGLLWIHLNRTMRVAGRRALGFTTPAWGWRRVREGSLEKQVRANPPTGPTPPHPTPPPLSGRQPGAGRTRTRHPVLTRPRVGGEG